MWQNGALMRLPSREGGMQVSCGDTRGKAWRKFSEPCGATMSSPETFVQDWVRKSPRAQQGLLRHWQQDLIRNQELADVMRGILQERDIQ